MKIYKNISAIFLLLLVITYSIDLHGLSHFVDNDQPDDHQQCEICIIQHQSEDNGIAILPLNEYTFNYDISNLYVAHNPIITSQKPSYNLYLKGQNFNRPPPAHL